MKNRIHQQLRKLIQTGSARHISRMAVCIQGIGATGLDGSDAQNSFEFIFATGDLGNGIDVRDRAAGVQSYVSSPALACLESEPEAIALVKRLEDAVGIKGALQWRCDDIENFLPDEAIEDLMLEHPAVDILVRTELQQEIGDLLLSDIEADLTDTIAYIAERTSDESDHLLP